MRKHGRNTHAHVVATGDSRDAMPGRQTLTRHEAMRAVGEVVYACRVASGLIKIGHTRDLAARLTALGGELLALMPGTYDDEQELHHRLADHLHHGREWYYPTPGVIAVVNDMRERLGQAPLVA